MDSARIIDVIETTLTRRGNGKTTPLRCVTQYWSPEGLLLAEVDPCPDGTYVPPGDPEIDIWLQPGAAVPVDIQTTGILIAEVQRLRAALTSGQHHE